MRYLTNSVISIKLKAKHFYNALDYQDLNEVVLSAIKDKLPLRKISFSNQNIVIDNLRYSLPVYPKLLFDADKQRAATLNFTPSVIRIMPLELQLKRS